MLFLKFREPTLYLSIPILLPALLPGREYTTSIATYNIGLPTLRCPLRSLSFVIAVYLSLPVHLRLSTIPLFGNLFSSVHLPVVNTANPGRV